MLKFARITTFSFVTVSMLIAIVKWGVGSADTTLVVALPLATSLVVYVGLGLLLPEHRAEVDDLLDSLNHDPVELDEVPTGRAPALS
jgi:hypothetical protein